MKPRSAPIKKRVSLAALVVLAVLLVLPGLAIRRLAEVLGMASVIGYFLLISALAFWFYGDDKRRAVTGEQRTPESILHFAEVLGGWPGAFLAQRVFRHKILKVRYQMVFWMIVAAHEAAFFDFVCGWQYSRNVWSWLFDSQSGRP